MINGKGDTPRLYNVKKYNENFNEINWKSKKQTEKDKITKDKNHDQQIKRTDE